MITLKEYLLKNNIDYKMKEDNLTVGGSLDLEGTGITSLPDNLTVGGSLYLRGTGITSLPDNLTVGGYLDLRGTGITSLPDNLTVGGSLNLRGTGITEKEIKKVKKSINYSLDIESKLTWKNGQYRKIDGIFCEVIRELKSCLKVKIGLDIKYVVFDGEHYSHGDTLKQAKEDLIYKRCNRDKSEYENMTPETILSFKDCVEMYRVITGACSSGVRHFVESSGNVKEKYYISEIIELTKGQYGSNAFIKFFDGEVKYAK